MIGGKLFETKNGAETWTHLDTGCLDTIWSFALSPVDSNLFFLVQSGVDPKNTCKNGVYSSNDGGTVWEYTNLEGDYFSNLTFSPISGASIYVATHRKLYRSDDVGKTWVLAAEKNLGNFSINLQAENKLYGTDWGKLLISENGGKSWQETKILNESINIFSSLDGEGMILGSQKGGIQISEDSGKTWALINNGLGADQMDLTPDPYHTKMLFAYKRDDGIFWENLYQSQDGGKTWRLINEKGRGIGFDADGETIYRAGDGLLLSTNQGTTWSKVPYRLWDFTTGFSVNPFVSGNLFIAAWPDNRPDLKCNTCLFTSTDKGQSWTEIAGENGLNGTLYWGKKYQYVYGKGMSSDSGITWQPCGQMEYRSSTSRVSPIAIDPRDDRVLFIATMGGGILKSTDACRYWYPVNTGLESLNVNSIVLDPNSPDTLYAGTDGGAYISQNAGETWSLISDGLLGVNVVYTIAIDPLDSTVYASTPYGIFTLEEK
ncbi:MAG: hypothetical protein FD147_1145 [Chloroflexi bacterium]|nr:MAG: hypothetical protein FD147_1145 [Chloroflexota bacterium]